MYCDQTRQSSTQIGLVPILHLANSYEANSIQLNKSLLNRSITTHTLLIHHQLRNLIQKHMWSFEME